VRSDDARRVLDDSHHAVPQRLVLLVAVLQQRHLAVARQVLPVGRLDVRGEAEEGLAWGGDTEEETRGRRHGGTSDANGHGRENYREQELH